jgi:hypothetical protein
MCAWCKSELETDSGVPDGGEARTVICPSCAENMLYQDGVDLQLYLDSLPVPVVLVDSNGRVKTANINALLLLNKNLTEIRGNLGGDVFECRYARLPGGCGKTVHCSGCTIRQSVNETFSTGKPVVNRLAYISGHSSRRLSLSISTELINGAVFLRVESLADKRCTGATRRNHLLPSRQKEF